VSKDFKNVVLALYTLTLKKTHGRLVRKHIDIL